MALWNDWNMDITMTTARLFLLLFLAAPLSSSGVHGLQSKLLNIMKPDLTPFAWNESEKVTLQQQWHPAFDGNASSTSTNEFNGSTRQVPSAGDTTEATLRTEKVSSTRESFLVSVLNDSERFTTGFNESTTLLPSATDVNATTHYHSASAGDVNATTVQSNTTLSFWRNECAINDVPMKHCWFYWLLRNHSHHNIFANHTHHNASWHDDYGGRRFHPAELVAITLLSFIAFCILVITCSCLCTCICCPARVAPHERMAPIRVYGN